MEIRDEICQKLGWHGSEDSLQALEAALSKETDESVLKEIREAMDCIKVREREKERQFDEDLLGFDLGLDPDDEDFLDFDLGEDSTDSDDEGFMDLDDEDLADFDELI